MGTAFVEVNEKSAGAAFEQVLGQLQASGQGLDRARVIGLVGCRNGDGTSYVLSTLASLLAKRSGKRVLQADSADLLRATRLTPAGLVDQCCHTDQQGRWTLSCPDKTEVTEVMESAPDLKRAMSTIDVRFDFLLLDCGAVTVSGRLWQLAHLLDDLLLVVAAGQTKRNQVTYAQQIIGQAGAHLSGCILNKRTYPLPSVLHRLLS